MMRILILLLLGVGSVARAQTATAPTSQTTATERAVTSVRAKYLAVDTTAGRVFMHLTTANANGDPLTPADFREHFLVNYIITPDYNTRERLGYGNVALTTANVTQGNGFISLEFEVKRPKGAVTGVLYTEITEAGGGKKSLHDLPLRFLAPKLSDRVALFDAQGQHPRLRNYVAATDTVLLRNVANTRKPLYVLRYRHEFDPAQSPMNMNARPAARSLNVDTTMTVMTGEPFKLPGEGLYFFLEDTTDTYGIGLIATDKRFPRLTRPDKLAKPVLYMSTGSEITQLNNAAEPKKALDRYWLSLMSGNEDVARQVLRAYYHRAEEANRLFTTYKEGWKTDKGMIFIVLGAPDRVQRARDREVWIYNRRANASEINFTFNRKANQFVEDHYELVRYVEYQPIWYPIVEAWRTGTIRE